MLTWFELNQQDWLAAMMTISEYCWSMSLHQDDYPKWTCRIWCDIPYHKLDVSDTAYDQLGALQNALVRAKKAIGE